MDETKVKNYANEVSTYIQDEDLVSYVSIMIRFIYYTLNVVLIYSCLNSKQFILFSTETSLTINTNVRIKAEENIRRHF